MSARDDLVLLGAVVGAFGVRGEVRVRSFTGVPEAIAAYGPLLDKTGRVVLTPKRLRQAGDDFALTAPEIKTREEAQALRGAGLYAPKTALPAPGDDEFYHIDLIGCALQALDGSFLGRVEAVRDFGAGDLLEVQPAEGPSWYLPFTKAAVPVVDLPRRLLISAEGPPNSGDEAADAG
ncbi:MAG: 16S rRNA processing protein RimM [Alphaproteobacteria bacterium]|nr:16S rRNA processing protein RimM [Alphaproteobacteria bacterium]